MGDVHLPLIFHSMVQPDASLFEYLLSFNGIDLNPILRKSPMSKCVDPVKSGMTLLHCLYAVIGGSLNGKFDMSRLKQLLSHDDVDINGGLDLPSSQGVMSPLYTTLISPIRFDSDFDVVKAFVEAGADAGPALSVASSSDYDIERGFATTLPHLNERMRRFIEKSGFAVL